ncbi:MAG TPA: hypothetical protein VGN37_25075 [Actinocatenispora sp.]
MAVLVSRLRLGVLALGFGAAALCTVVLPGNVVMRLAFGMVGGTFGRDALLMATGLLLGAATELVRRRTGAGCDRCGRIRSLPTRPDGTVVPPRWLRVATYAAAAVPLAAFSLPHLLWALHVPFGVRPGVTDGVGLTGTMLFLVAGPAVGALLTVGLVRRWGQVFPRLLPLVGGRRVPRPLAVLPPLLPGLLVLQYGVLTVRCLVPAALGLTRTCFGHSAEVALDNWAFAATYPVFLCWGLGLTVAALGYGWLTRPRCRSCDRR